MLSSACASCTSSPRLTERAVCSLVLAGIMPLCPSASFRGLLSSACKTRPPNFSSVAQRGKCMLNTTAIQFRTDVPSSVNLTSVTPLKPGSAFILSGSLGNAHSLSPPVVHCTCHALYNASVSLSFSSLVLLSKTIYVLF